MFSYPAGFALLHETLQLREILFDGNRRAHIPARGKNISSSSRGLQIAWSRIPERAHLRMHQGSKRADVETWVYLLNLSLAPRRGTNKLRSEAECLKLFPRQAGSPPRPFSFSGPRSPPFEGPGEPGSWTRDATATRAPFSPRK